MSKPKNPNNVYLFICKVTGETTMTNPKQFRNTALRYGVTDAVLRESYVSRKGRKILEESKISMEDAITKYGIHPDVAKSLKALRAPAAPTSRQTVEMPAPATPAVNAVQETETPVTSEPEIVLYDASLDEEEVDAKAVAA